MRNIEKVNTSLRLAFNCDIARRYAERRTRSFALFALLCLLPNLSAQDWKSDLERASRVYSGENLELEMELHFFTSPTATVPASKEKISMYKAGDNYWVKQFGIEMIHNSQYMVLIDENNRMISVGKNREPQKANEISSETKEMFQHAVKDLVTTLGIDTVFSKPRFSSENRGKTGGSQVYQFFYTQGKYSESTVYISAKTGLLEKVSCLLRDPVETAEGVLSRVRIDFLFLKQEGNRKPDKSLFSTDGVFTVNAAGKIVLKDKYRQYQLIVN